MRNLFTKKYVQENSNWKFGAVKSLEIMHLKIIFRFYQKSNQNQKKSIEVFQFLNFNYYLCHPLIWP